MEQNTPKFRLRLNLFDAIILVVVLLAGAVVGNQKLFNRFNADLIHKGSPLVAFCTGIPKKQAEILPLYAVLTTGKA